MYWRACLYGALRAAMGGTAVRSVWRRKTFSRFMDIVTGLCAVLVLGLLFVILGHILVGGLRSLNFEFLVNSPRPVGETGGGIANAIVGSIILVGLASACGLPVGILAGIYLAEFSSNRFGHLL